MIGSPPNALLTAFLAQTHGIRVSFLDYMMIGVPIVVVATPLSTYAAYSYEVGWCANETGTDVLRFGPFFSPEQAQSQQASRLMPVMSGAANRAAPVRGAP